MYVSLLGAGSDASGSRAAAAQQGANGMKTLTASCVKVMIDIPNFVERL